VFGSSKALVAPEPLPEIFGPCADLGELGEIVGDNDVPLVITVLQEEENFTLPVPS
jgi:hypothetical protein